MRQLSKVIFINGAGIRYGEVRLDGNVHLSAGLRHSWAPSSGREKQPRRPAGTTDLLCMLFDILNILFGKDRSTVFNHTILASLAKIWKFGEKNYGWRYSTCARFLTTALTLQVFGPPSAFWGPKCTRPA